MVWQPGICCSVLHVQGVVSTVSVRAPKTCVSSDPVLVNAPVLRRVHCSRATRKTGELPATHLSPGAKTQDLGVSTSGSAGCF